VGPRAPSLATDRVAFGLAGCFPRNAVIGDGWPRGLRGRMGKHDEPLFIERFLECLVFGPNNHFDDIVDGTARSFHDTANISEHELALALDIRWYFPRFRIHPEYSAAHHERTNNAS